MKYFFKRDTILATFAVFLVMGLLSLVPLNTHLLDPLKLALSDLRFNDMSFSTLKIHRDNAVDKKLMVVNIGNANRSEIAAVIKILDSAGPAAIGLDVLFNEAKDGMSDSVLADVIKKSSLLVLSVKPDFEHGSVSEHGDFFKTETSHFGYVNLVGEKKGVIRYFSPFEKYQNTVINSFSAAVVQQADEVRFGQLKKRNHALENINYQRQSDQYFIVNYQDLLSDRTDKTIFKDKIILVGYVDDNPANIEDKHYTPLNEKFAGKSIPDMNGVIIQANIISMILENNYIYQSPSWINWVLAVLLTWFFVAFILRYYLEHHMWFHLSAKSVQLLLTVFFIYLGILFSKYLNTSIDFAAVMGGIVLAVDVLYFYEGFAHWANKRFSFRTQFSKSKH